jgi:succinoglycan biosynthesis transport protein ExoP
VAPDGTNDQTRFRLRSQLRALGRRWKMITLLAVTTLALALALTAAQDPTYRASADILLSPTTFDVQRGGATLTAEEIATQAQVVTSLPVAEMVQDDLGLTEVPELDDHVTVEALGSSRVLRVTATSQNADEAFDLADSVSSQYLSYRRTNTQRSLTEVASTLTDRQQQLENRIDLLDRELRRDAGARTGELEAERRNLLSQLGQVTAQLAGLDVTVSAGAGGDVLTEPKTPEDPVSPRPLLTGILGFLAGLLIGIAVAVLRNRLDEVVHDEEAVQESLGVIPIVGRVPRWKASRGDTRLVTVARPDSRASQSFQGISARVRSMLEHVRVERGGGAVVMCTSAEALEGKSVLAANLAVAAARVGMRVVLVDADLRRSSPGRMLPGVDEDAPGLSELLRGEDSPASYLVSGPIENLLVLPPGSRTDNPTELVSSPRLRSLLRGLCERADLVIIDTPPTLWYADSLEMAHAADLILLVARLNHSRVGAVNAVAERLLHVGGSAVAGVVLDGTGRSSDANPQARRAWKRQQGGGPTPPAPQETVSRR